MRVLKVLDRWEQTLRPHSLPRQASGRQELAGHDAGAGCHWLLHRPPPQREEGARSAQQILCRRGSEQSFEVFLRRGWTLPHCEERTPQVDDRRRDSILNKVKDAWFTNPWFTSDLYWFGNIFYWPFSWILHAFCVRFFCIRFVDWNGRNWS